MVGKEVVINIRLSEDLPTYAQNKLRYAIEMGIWRGKWRKAVEEDDSEAMEALDRQYDLVGLP